MPVREETVSEPNHPSCSIVALAEQPDLREQLGHLHGEAWPAFFAGDEAERRYWPELDSTFPDFQVVLCDASNTVLGLGQSIPITWDGTVSGLPEGWDAVIAQGFEERDRRKTPNTLSALAAVIAPRHRGRGLSRTIVRAMKSVAARHGLTTLIVPVRPTLKHRYPLTPMERYVEWKQSDGSPFDPWIRVHWRLGAETLRIAAQSMVVTGTVAEWEQWTDMRFPDSGPYIVDGALQPVMIDREKDVGRYEDPNVWMRHGLDDVELDQ